MPPRHPSLLPVFLLALASSAAAQGWTSAEGSSVPIPEGADALLAPDDPLALVQALLDEAVAADGPGLVLEVLLDGEPVFAGARGLADLERGIPCSAASVFDMASLAKSVTAAALATLVEQGTLDLDAGVRRYLPELSAAYEPVRLRHLVHHTAGVEDDDGTLALAGWPETGAAPFADALRLLGRLEHLRFAPGTQHMYSNGGYLLLAAVVERVAGEPLPSWAARHLFEPLGLSSARLAAQAGELVPARALPYALVAGEQRQRSTAARHGPGGLLCTVGDLARWADALRTGAGRTGAGIGAQVAARLRERGRLADGSALDYAFGLARSSEGGRECWSHTGSSPGGQSAMAFYPESGLTLAAASNSIDGENVRRLLARVADALLGAPVAAAPTARPGMVFIDSAQETPPASRGVTVDAERLASLAGVYDMQEGPALVFASEGQRLLIGFDGEPSIEVFPLPSGRFVLPSVGYELSFEPEEERVTLHLAQGSARGGAARDIHGTRRRLAPLDAARAAQLAGHYRSAELGASYEVVWRDGELWLEHPCHGVLRLRALDADTYTLPGHALAQLAFVRRQDRVAGFELQAYSWGVRAFFARG